MATSEVKPGVKTTEFWITIVTAVIGMALLTYGVVTGKEIAIIIGGSMAGVPVAGYSVSRGSVKNAASLILLAFIASFALTACATTEQKQPTKQEQPQDQTSAQSDEQWADIRINATNNFYGASGASKRPAVVDGDTVTEATPGEGDSATSAASFLSSPVSVSITVTTHGQSSKEGTTGQTGGSQSSNTSATATPTNTPTTEVPISVTPVP